MGGENSEITEKTRDVALESAYFNPLFIRKTARRLGIRSEASLRFEKGIDIERVDISARRAIELMKAISGGTIVRGRKEIWRKAEPKRIFVSYNKINTILGVAIDPEDAVNALSSIEIEGDKGRGRRPFLLGTLFRHDIEEYLDLIEEIIRIYGFEISIQPPPYLLPSHQREKRMRFLSHPEEYFKVLDFLRQ
jgi:phenylalanyl-tRNA synthetase beta chain